MYLVRKIDGLINFRGFSIAACLTASTRCLSSSPLRPCDIMQKGQSKLTGPWQDVVVTNPTIWCFYQAAMTIPTHPSLHPHSCTGHQWQGHSPASCPLPLPALAQSSPAGKAVSVWICSHHLEPIWGVRCIFENLNVGGLNLNTCFLQWTVGSLQWRRKSGNSFTTTPRSGSYPQDWKSCCKWSFPFFEWNRFLISSLTLELPFESTFITRCIRKSIAFWDSRSSPGMGVSWDPFSRSRDGWVPGDELLAVEGLGSATRAVLRQGVATGTVGTSDSTALLTARERAGPPLLDLETSGCFGVFWSSESISVGEHGDSNCFRSNK